VVSPIYSCGDEELTFQAEGGLSRFTFRRLGGRTRTRPSNP